MEKTIDKSRGVPKYVQLMDILKERIKDCEIGEKFHTEQELRSEFKLSASTVARAMRELTLEGYLVRKTGGGSFVKSRNASPVNDAPSDCQSEFIVACKFLNDEIYNNPCNWFLWHEIQRGIVNACKNPVSIISENDLNNRISADFKQPVILLTQELDTVKRLNKLNSPYVLINNMFTESQPENAVNLDRMSGAYDAMSYLFDDLGHKRIALIAGDYPSHAHRIAAYYIAHVSRGIEVDEKLVFKVKGGDESAGYMAMKKLIDSGVEFSAVFVNTDEKAKGVYSAIKEAGQNIPDDISVVGFDDIPEAAGMSPQLTTVGGNYYELGFSAVELLYKRLEKKSSLPSVTIKTKLKIRESARAFKG
jgi:DNA-binding transcriptional regulator YhcF (GntR family)